MLPPRFPWPGKRTGPKTLRSTGFAIAAWSIVTLAAVTVGVLFSGALTSQDGMRILNAAEVDQALANLSTQQAPQTGSASPGNPGNPGGPGVSAAAPGTADAVQPAILRSTGGTLVASCSDGTAQILSSTAAQGFRVDGDEKKDGKKSAQVTYESESVKIYAQVICTGGIPSLQETRTPGSADHEPDSGS